MIEWPFVVLSYGVEGQMDNPYLSKHRLNDIVAMISVMSITRKYRMPLEDWIYHFSGAHPDKQTPEIKTKWKNVLDQHTEFFRPSASYQGNYALVMRRALKNPDGTRPALTESQTKLLIDTAIELHSKQFEAKRDRRWWISVTLPFIGGLLGATLGVALKFYLSPNS